MAAGRPKSIPRGTLGVRERLGCHWNDTTLLAEDAVTAIETEAVF